jgi:hypothetical protein
MSILKAAGIYVEYGCRFASVQVSAFTSMMQAQQRQQMVDTSGPTQKRVASSLSQPSMPGGWVHRFFALHEDEVAAIEYAGGRDITDENIKVLSSKSARLENDLGSAAPRVACRYCSRAMSWDPSTKRKVHLFQCDLFLASKEAKDHSQFQRERSDWIEKKALQHRCDQCAASRATLQMT